MKSKLIIALLSSFILILGCKKKEVPSENVTYYIDSLETRKKAEEMTDSLLNATVKSKYTSDQSNIEFPIVVTSSKLVMKEYSNRRDIKLTYKNVSGKRVEAIRFEWYGENAFGEPADMGDSFLLGAGRGQTDEPLNPGKTDSGTWEISSSDAKKNLECAGVRSSFF